VALTDGCEFPELLSGGASNADVLYVSWTPSKRLQHLQTAVCPHRVTPPPPPPEDTVSSGFRRQKWKKKKKQGKITSCFPTLESQRSTHVISRCDAVGLTGGQEVMLTFSAAAALVYQDKQKVEKCRLLRRRRLDDERSVVFWQHLYLSANSGTDAIQDGESGSGSHKWGPSIAFPSN